MEAISIFRDGRLRVHISDSVPGEIQQSCEQHHTAGTRPAFTLHKKFLLAFAFHACLHLRKFQAEMKAGIATLEGLGQMAALHEAHRHYRFQEIQ